MLRQLYSNLLLWWQKRGYLFAIVVIGLMGVGYALYFLIYRVNLAPFTRVQGSGLGGVEILWKNIVVVDALLILWLYGFFLLALILLELAFYLGGTPVLLLRKPLLAVGGVSVISMVIGSTFGGIRFFIYFLFLLLGVMVYNALKVGYKVKLRKKRQQNGAASKSRTS